MAGEKSGSAQMLTAVRWKGRTQYSPYEILSMLKVSSPNPKMTRTIVQISAFLSSKPLHPISYLPSSDGCAKDI